MPGTRAVTAPWQSVEVIQRLRRGDSTLPVIVLAPDSSEELAIAALRAGVQDYFGAPVPVAVLMASVHRLLATGRASASLPSSAPGAPAHRDKSPMIGESVRIQHIKAYIEKVDRNFKRCFATAAAALLWLPVASWLARGDISSTPVLIVRHRIIIQSDSGIIFLYDSCALAILQ